MSKNSNGVKPFALAFGNLPGNQQPLVKDEIMKACNWKSQQLFTMKMYGRRGLTEHEDSVISFTFQKRGIEAYTGNSIKETV